jgi:hypothetical protein
MVFQNNVLSGSAGSGTTVHTIDQSIRFNSADSAYMHRTPSSSGNRKTFTSSFWVKFGDLTNCALPFPSVLQNANYGAFLSSGIIQFFIYYSGSWQGQLYTNRVFRDPAAWYHFVIVVDTTNATPTERVRIYVNGQRETSFSTENYPNLNQDTDWNNSGEKMGIGVSANGFSSSFGEYYAAEMVFIDGTAYGPENFGEYNSSGIWIPKDVSGLSFGTNGFHIDGRDSSDLGDDESGQGNDFTVVNLATNDQKADSPTNNQITFNPLNNQRSGGTPSNGNLDYVGPGTRTLISLTANIPSTGKWAVAFKVAQVSTSQGWQIGIAPANQSDFGDAAGSNEDLKLIRMFPSGSDLEIGDYVNSASINPSQPITTSDEFWVAVDMDSGNVYLGIYDASATAMVWIANDAGLDGNPATGANPTVTYNTTQMPRDNVVFAVASKQTSQHVYLQRSTDVSGTTPTGYTYFENVKDLI